jgi:ABC-type Fe3+-hydroxamate transport system substrate-binding protein
VRAVSLVPSITETLREWRVAPVGVTRFCEAPGVQTVGGTKNPDIEAILALHPDLVLMDREENRSEDAEALAAAGVQVHATHVRSVADVVPALAGIATLLGVDVDPSAFDPVPLPGGPFFRAWIPIWRRPWMTINHDTYGSSVLAVAGVENVFADDADRYPQVSIDEAKRRGPDLVLAPSEPYPFSERHRAELEDVAPVEFVDGQDLFWWGARTPRAAGRLRALAAGLATR